MNQRITKTSLFLIMIALFLFASCSKNYEVSSVALNKSSVSFTIGQTDSLIATVTANGDLNKFPVTWTTTDPTVITVVKGKIVGVSKGTATITAKAGGVTATCSVTVTDEINPTLTKGALVYFGDTLFSKTLNNGTSYTSISNLFIVELVGKTDTLLLYVDAALTDITSLSVGSYQLLTSANNLSDLVPLSIIPGDVYDGEDESSWYYGNALKSPITDGYFTITSLSSNIYTITYNFIDNYGNTIYGTYQSSLTFHNATTSSAAPAAIKSILNSRMTKISSKALKLIKIK